MKKTVTEFWPNPRDYTGESIDRYRREHESNAWYSRLTIEPSHALWSVITHEVDDRGIPFHAHYLIDAPTPRDALKELERLKKEGSFHNVSIRPFHGEIFNGGA